METPPPKPLPDWEKYANLVECFWDAVGPFFRANEAVDVLVDTKLADNRIHATDLCVAMLQDGVFLRVGAPPAPFRDHHDYRYRLTWSNAKDTGANVRLQRAPALPAPIASLPRKRSTPPPEFDDAISEASGEWQVKPAEYDDPLPNPNHIVQHQFQQHVPEPTPRLSSNVQLASNHPLISPSRRVPSFSSPLEEPLPQQRDSSYSSQHEESLPSPSPPPLPPPPPPQQQQVSPFRAAFERISPRAKKERIRSSSRGAYRLPGSTYNQNTTPLVRTPSLGTRDYRVDETGANVKVSNVHHRIKHNRAASFDIPPPNHHLEPSNDYSQSTTTTLEIRASTDDKFIAGSRREQMYRAASFDVAPAPAFMRPPSIDVTNRRSSRDTFVGLSRAPWRPPTIDNIELARSASVGTQYYADHRNNQTVLNRSTSVDGRHCGDETKQTQNSATALARSSSVDGRVRIKKSRNQYGRQIPLRPPNDSYSSPKRRENPFDISRFVPGRNNANKNSSSPPPPPPDRTTTTTTTTTEPNVHRKLNDTSFSRDRRPSPNANKFVKIENPNSSPLDTSNANHFVGNLPLLRNPISSPPNFDSEPNGNIQVSHVVKPSNYDDFAFVNGNTVVHKVIPDLATDDCGLGDTGEKKIDHSAPSINRVEVSCVLERDGRTLRVDEVNRNLLKFEEVAPIDEVKLNRNSSEANQVRPIDEVDLNQNLSNLEQTIPIEGVEVKQASSIDELKLNRVSSEVNNSELALSEPVVSGIDESKIATKVESVIEANEIDSIMNESSVSSPYVAADEEMTEFSPQITPLNNEEDDLVTELEEISISTVKNPSNLDDETSIAEHNEKDGTGISPQHLDHAMNGTRISTQVPPSNIESTSELVHAKQEVRISPEVITPDMNGSLPSRNLISVGSDVAHLRIDSSRFISARNESTGISSEVTSSPVDPTLVKKEVSSEIFGSPYGPITTFEARGEGVRVIDIHRGNAVVGIPVEKEEVEEQSDNSNMLNSLGGKENGDGGEGTRTRREESGHAKRRKSSRRFMRNASEASLFGEDNVSVPHPRGLKHSSTTAAFMTRNASDASLFDEDSVGVNHLRVAVTRSEESGSRKMPFPSWDNEDFGSQFDVCRSFDVSKQSGVQVTQVREPVALAAMAATADKRDYNSARKGHEELQRSPFIRAPSIDVSVMANSDDFEIEGEEPRAMSMDVPRTNRDVTQPSVERRAIQLARNRNRISVVKPEPLPNVSALREKLARAFQQQPVETQTQSPALPTPPAVIVPEETKIQQEHRQSQKVAPSGRETESSPVTTPRRPWRFLRILSRGREEERASSTFTDSEGDPSSHKYRTTSSFRDRFVNSLRRNTRRAAGRDAFADREDPTEQAWRSR